MPSTDAPVTNTPPDVDSNPLLDADFGGDPSLADVGGLVAAGLLGAALGAGLGWLASRSAAGARRPPRDAARGPRRDTPRAADRAGHMTDDVRMAARRAAAALERTRAEFEQQLEAGLRDVWRAGRRAARRFG